MKNKIILLLSILLLITSWYAFHFIFLSKAFYDGKYSQEIYCREYNNEDTTLRTVMAYSWRPKYTDRVRGFSLSPQIDYFTWHCNTGDYNMIQMNFKFRKIEKKFEPYEVDVVGIRSKSIDFSGTGVLVPLIGIKAKEIKKYE